ncbi:MAG TPA: phosphatase PAP2 family protein [Elusimicrobiota bacterium]|nr:phosphatase PAP2 family protein [Elusimicrobiota bacterium]
MSKRWIAVAAGLAVIFASYEATDHWHWLTPYVLPTTALDRLVPFVPGATPLYLSYFLFLPLVLFTLRDEASFRRTLGAMVLAGAASAAVFFLWPTVLVRPHADGFLFGLVTSLDSGANCCPSQHVALACIAALGLRDDRSRWAAPGALWAAAICASTLLIKQHYVVDVAAGAALAAACFGLAGRSAVPSRSSAMSGEAPHPERAKT